MHGFTRGIPIDTDPTLSANLDTVVPSQKAVLTYMTTSFQPINLDLTNIAALIPANDDIIQRKAGAWTNRTIAQYYADLQASVKDDVYFCLPFAFTNTNPADSTTYYFGSEYTQVLATGATSRYFQIPYDCTLIGYSAFINYTVGTGENSQLYARINNTTDVQLGGNWPGTNGIFGYGAGGSTNVTAGQIINIKWVCPAWATNPTAARGTVVLYFKRR